MLTLYGHCFGAIVAFETAMRLEAVGTRVTALWTGSSLAPARQYLAPRVAYKQDDDFLADLSAFAPAVPTPLIPFVLPTLRADIRALESYRATPGRLGAEIGTLHATNDQLVPLSEATRWQTCTTGAFQLVEVEAGHFLLPEARDIIIRCVTDAHDGRN